MDNLKINIIRTILTLPGHLFVYLKNSLVSGLSYPFKQEMIDSIDFLRTLDNIRILGGAPQRALLEGPSVTEKNLLACAACGADFHETGQPAHNPSIIHRNGSALGCTLQLPIEEKPTSTPVKLPEIWPVIWVLAKK